MPLPLPDLDTRLLRFSFILGGNLVPCAPSTGGDVKLTGELDEQGFFLRDKLTPGLVFGGEDYLLLSRIENSADRCLPVGLLLEARPHERSAWATAYQGVFTCAECAFDLDACTASVTPTTDDAYRLLLEGWDQEYNILGTPGVAGVPEGRLQVSAELANLQGQTVPAFRRTDDRDANYSDLQAEGWSPFLKSTSWISDGPLAGTRDHTIILFRYELRNTPMTLDPATGNYLPVNRSGAGWTVNDASRNNSVTPPTISYYKAPSISGFRPYEITSYNNWTQPTNPKATPKYGGALLLLPTDKVPADYGYSGTYQQVTGPGGAFSDATAPYLNIRSDVDDVRPRSLWWRFGSFLFGRCFPLLDGVHYLLQQTALAAGRPQLVPPIATQLSSFYSAPVNQATGEAGAANELPRLLLSASSDVKRYGASEAATRLLISLRQLVMDLSALHDVRWFVDPVTGYFRLEHRAYAEAQEAAGAVVDLTAIAEAVMPRAYSARQQQLPRYEELTIANATTVDMKALLDTYEVDFAKGVIDYGMASCTNKREGQNRATLSASRLSGDVGAMVLSGDSIPDNALAILAPDAEGGLPDANRVLSASRLLQRYHRYGRNAYVATANGLPLVMESLRPQREQAGITVPLCAAEGLTPTTRLTTSLGVNGRLAKREMNLKTGQVTLTVWLPIPDTDMPATLPTGRQFDNSFDRSFW